MSVTKYLLLPLLLLQTGLLYGNEAFPHRSLYPKVKTIELEELYSRRNEVVIFDVRSAYEYDTLHIKGAQHLPLNGSDFVGTLTQLRKNEQRAFVFYCNGHTCKKSYKAAQKARHGRIRDVFAFDAGIFDWTKAHPNEAVLLGKTPVDPARLISKERLNAHMLAPEEFGQRVGKSAITLDIRDSLQKEGVNLFPTRQRSVPLDNNRLKTYVDKARNQGKTLLIYDAVGKQVRWLQYYLEDEGLSSYFFMRGGAKAFLEF